MDSSKTNEQHANGLESQSDGSKHEEGVISNGPLHHDIKYDPGNPTHVRFRDLGYVEPYQEVKCEGLAILDATNYNGFKDLDVDLAKLHFEHELPPHYSIVKQIGHGAFGRCFLVEKQSSVFTFSTKTLYDPADDAPDVSSNKCQVVLKVVRGAIKPRRPVLFYKSCSLYTIMISFKALPLSIENFKFIVGMVKFLHVNYGEVHGDLNPGNMMYIPKDMKRSLFTSAFDTPQGWPLLAPVTKNQIHVLYDFLDHWFSIGDEQYACIIDADIGGKIGEEKVVVNHMHHDPRNASWQVSDDLIGLLNWVVIDMGYPVNSHATRGMEYGVTLKSLQQLHMHIINVYENVDCDYVYAHTLSGPERTPFIVKLKPGKSYLSELVKGTFLKFESFQGSYSLASSGSVITSCVKMHAFEVAFPASITAVELRKTFSKIASEKYLSTLNRALDLLCSDLPGGVVLLLVDKKHKSELKISSLDNECLTNFCRKEVNTIHKELFQPLLRMFGTHSKTDRWEQSLLRDLAVSFGKEQTKMFSFSFKRKSRERFPELEALRNQPKDGAFVISCSGTVLAAAAHLQFPQHHYQLCKMDGTRFGTRHAAAMAAAEWMRLESISGTVFVRSDAGELHVMLPHGQESSELGESPWETKGGQKVPQVFCIKE